MSVDVQSQPANERSPIFRDILTVPVSLALEEAVAELLAEFPAFSLGVVTGAILFSARTASSTDTRETIMTRARERLRS